VLASQATLSKHWQRCIIATNWTGVSIIQALSGRRSGCEAFGKIGHNFTTNGKTPVGKHLAPYLSKRELLLLV